VATATFGASVIVTTSLIVSEGLLETGNVAFFVIPFPNDLS
jgi:hypothetical protein